MKGKVSARPTTSSLKWNTSRHFAKWPILMPPFYRSAEKRMRGMPLVYRFRIAPPKPNRVMIPRDTIARAFQPRVHDFQLLLRANSAHTHPLAAACCRLFLNVRSRNRARRVASSVAGQTLTHTYRHMKRGKGCNTQEKRKSTNITTHTL